MVNHSYLCQLKLGNLKDDMTRIFKTANFICRFEQFVNVKNWVNVSFNFRNILPFNITLTFMDNPPIDHIFDCVNIVTSNKWMKQYVSNIHNRLALLKWPIVLSEQLDVMIITDWCTCLMFNILSFASFSDVHVCFYHAMHFNAKCGIMIPCRFSVCPSESWWIVIT